MITARVRMPAAINPSVAVTGSAWMASRTNSAANRVMSRCDTIFILLPLERYVKVRCELVRFCDDCHRWLVDVGRHIFDVSAFRVCKLLEPCG